jgi:TPR repeat protein
VEALPHDPRRAVLLYTILSEQGSLEAGINAAWLLERSDGSEYAGRRDSLIRYMYTRAALADSPHAQIDYANWLLKTALSEQQEQEVPPLHDGGVPESRELGESGGRMESRGAQLPGGGPPSSRSAIGATVSDSDVDWAVSLRMGLAGGKMHQGSGAIEQALLLYARARQLRDPEGATNLAWMHAAGMGVRRNVTAAIEECKTAIKIASTEAEKLAPRVALIAFNVWAFFERLLPEDMEEPFGEAVGSLAKSLIKSLAATMDQIDVVAAPLANVWN